MASQDKPSPATADLVDQFVEELRFCLLPFHDFGGRKAFCGQIRTVVGCEDNKLVKETLGGAGEGRVLVIDGGGSLRTALMGDLIAEIGRASGWSGVIINGAVRSVGHDPNRLLERVSSTIRTVTSLRQSGPGLRGGLLHTWQCSSIRVPQLNLLRP